MSYLYYTAAVPKLSCYATHLKDYIFFGAQLMSIVFLIYSVQRKRLFLSQSIHARTVTESMRKKLLSKLLLLKAMRLLMNVLESKQFNPFRGLLLKC